MRIESRIHQEGDLHRFEIVDADDNFVVAGTDIQIPESLHLSKTYARRDTAERNASGWIKKFKAATESVKRKLCGYDPVSACKRELRQGPFTRKKR